MSASASYIFGIGSTSISKLVLFYKNYKTSKSIGTSATNPVTIATVTDGSCTAYINSSSWDSNIAWLESLAEDDNAYVSLDGTGYNSVTNPTELAETILNTIVSNSYRGTITASYESINYTTTVKAALDDIYNQFGNPMRWASVPTSRSSTGVAGQIAKDSSYLYVCVADDTWKRIALETITQEETSE